MKELLGRMASYNAWANKRLVELMLTLPEENCTREIASSFPGLLRTVLHMWDAEAVWWQRLRLQEHVIWPGAGFSGGFADAAEGLLRQSQIWEDWARRASVISLEHVIQYQNSKRETFKIQTAQMLQHVFNHSTYHRGQLVTMLRQLGADKIPATDYFLWSRTAK